MRQGQHRHYGLASCLSRAQALQPRRYPEPGAVDVQRNEAPTLAELRASIQRVPAARRNMALLRETYLILWKDLLLELRRRDSVLTMFFFGTLLLFVFHFSFDLAPEKVAEMAPAL